jgi:type I restriction enzyme S subunit
MGSEFDVEPFGSLLSNVVDNRGRTCPTAPSGIPLIATNCVANDSLYPRYDTVRYVDEQTYQTWFRGHPEPGDFLFVLKGSPGRVCLVPDPVDFCIAQDMVAVRADPRRVYPRFLFALLRSEPVQRQIEHLHVGTMIPHFRKGDFDKLLLPLPSRAVQEYVGDSYWTLSQKIDLNRRMSQTLESIARALFKSWFVDFDPVRAKAEGRDPGLPRHIADLFPSSFEDSSGGIPAGWRLGVVADIADVYSGSRPDAQRLASSEDAKVPVWGGNGPTGYVDQALLDGPILLTGRVGTLGSVFRITSPSWPSDNTLILKPKDEIGFEYVYLLLLDLDLASLNRGSTQPLLTQSDLRAQPALLPPRPILKRFHDACRRLFERIDRSDAESLALGSLRNTQMPVLMSGGQPINGFRSSSGEIR